MPYWWVPTAIEVEAEDEYEAQRRVYAALSKFVQDNKAITDCFIHEVDAVEWSAPNEEVED